MLLFLKRRFPILIAFTGGTLFIAQYFVPHPSSQLALREVNKWLQIIGGIALLLGVWSVSHHHWRKIRAGVAGWGYSAVLLAALAFGCAVGFWGGIEEKTPFQEWIFGPMILPMQAAMFSVLGFFIASAAFRAFRAKSLEATLLLFSAAVIMLGQIPLGAMISDAIPAFSAWILGVPNIAAKRALLFGVALGSIATSLRIIFGIERSYLGGRD